MNLRNLKRKLLGWIFAAELNELERTTVQLAGVLTAAEGWDRPPVKQGDWGWSLPYEKVRALYAEREALRAEREALLRTVAKLTPPRARFDRHVEMDEKAVSEALAGMAPMPAARAIMQLLDTKVAQANDAAINPQLSEAEMRFNLGGVDWLTLFKAELQAALERPKEGN